MLSINAIDCSTGIKNSGVGTCFLFPSFMRGALKVSPDFRIPGTYADSLALRTALIAAAQADNASQRLFPLHNFKTITDNTEDTVMQTMGDGTQVPVRDGNYNLTFQYLDGGLCLHQNLRSWNGNGYYLFYDDQFIIYGWRQQNEDGTYSIGGIPALFRANPWKFNDGSNVANFSVYFSFAPTYLNDSLGFIKAGFNLAEVKGLQTMVLQQGNTAPAAGVIHVQVKAGCDYANQFDLYGTDLADEALWIAINAATGNEIDITSVTASGSGDTGEMIVTLDSTDPDYPTTTTSKVTLKLVGPTELAAADIVGFESNTLTVNRG